MKIKQNLHLHTTYCDGSNTPEEMADAAISQGFDSLGFSGHARMDGFGWCMTEENTQKYFDHITRLKKDYAGRLKVYLGLEYDLFSQCDTSLCDYLIGSVHCFWLEGQVVTFDFSKPQRVQALIDRYFGGDGMAYAKCYYETLAQLPQAGKFDILGHVDIITKHCRSVQFFDANSADYRRWACEALDALAGQIPMFELNTGAISRGYRTTPYPAPFLLDELKKRDFKAVITSDCHQAENLSCYYPEAEKLLWDHGFRELWVLTDDGFVATPL